MHTEWIDPDGICEARRGLKKLETQFPSLKPSRFSYLHAYLDAVDSAYGPSQKGPQGQMARPLRCVYVRVRDGRMHCVPSNKLAPRGSSKFQQYVCVQSMPRSLRPFLLRKWGRDLDIENCHVNIMYQLGRSYHLWSEHASTVAPLTLDTMEQLSTHRTNFIEQVADAHAIESDENHYAGYRKDIVKQLLLRVMYGGSYNGWMRERGYFGVPCRLVMALQKEIRSLRRAVLCSQRFKNIVDTETLVQKQRGREGEVAERSIFSKVAQHLECNVLLSMRAYMLANGWTVISLIHDGLIVQHREGVDVDLLALCAWIERETQFSLRVVEKPLFSETAPKDHILVEC